MMLAAIPASCTPVFTHDHTPTGMTNPSPPQTNLSPDCSPGQQQQQQQQQQRQSCTLGNGGRNMDDRKIPPVSSTSGQVFHNQVPPQLIPMQQSLILGMGGASGCTILPSIAQLNNERTMVGFQPLGSLPSTPMPSTFQPITALPFSCYGRVPSEVTQPLSFPAPLASNNADMRQFGMTAIPSLTLLPHPALAAATVSSPQHQQPSQHLHPLLTSGARTTPVLNRAHRADFSSKSTLHSIPSSTISSNDVDVHTMPMLSSPQPSVIPQSHSLLDTSLTLSTVTTNSFNSSLSSSSNTERLNQRMDPEQGSIGRKRPAPIDTVASNSDSASRDVAWQAARFSSTPGSSSPSSSNLVDDRSLLRDVRVKMEPLTEDTPTLHHPHSTRRSSDPQSTRRSSDSNLEEVGSSSSRSYQVSALIDAPPMTAALNKASRTSSLSSSISSFRFGGSLSQLWASQLSSQISLGKINNMKSTG